MIISISGRIGSGKDLTGKIIQWLVTSKTGFGNGTYSDKECVEWLNGKYPGDTSIENISGYQIKKFADKLKDIVCILIGCSRKDLEDRGFKETELGEEWWIYKFPSGGISSYKKNVPSFWSKYLIKLTPRLIMQLVGTEAGRNIIHPDLWCTSLFNDYKEKVVNFPKDYLYITESDVRKLNQTDYQEVSNKYGFEYLDDFWDKFNEDLIFCRKNNTIHKIKVRKVHDIYNDYLVGDIVDHTNNVLIKDTPKWIITDTRFPNELQAVKDRGGISIRVNRDVELRLPNKYEEFVNQGNILNWEDFHIEHESETALDNFKVDYEIDNNGSIEDLIEQVRLILIKENII